MKIPATVVLALATWQTPSPCDAFPFHPNLPATSGRSSHVLRAATAPEPPAAPAADVEFPPPLTKAQRLQRAAKFWSSALPIVLSYYSKDAELRVKEAVTGATLTPAEEERVWNAQHAKGARELAATITSLKGFYVKTAQIIASRRDLFPPEYTTALSDFTDNVDPLPAELLKAVVARDLLVRGEAFEDIFAEFDEAPLGAASVAQVHRAVLTEKYGGKEVAVKVQRVSSLEHPAVPPRGTVLVRFLEDHVSFFRIRFQPSIESKLMGDIANLKALAKTFRDSDALPLDYYTVFSELEKQLGQ